jgi:UDP-N-acetylglucosamine 2-epimerase (non-hydrolysing)
MDGARMKIGVVMGTRPQIIKMSPFILELEKRDIDHFVIDTGQHTLPVMQRKIYEDLGLSQPKHMMSDYEYGNTACRVQQLLALEKPDMVQVHGDTDSAVIGALAAASLGIQIGHHEAGLRAGTLWMREEQNRILVDHMSDWMFAPTAAALKNLKRELVVGVARVTGNMISDVLRKHADDTVVEGQSDYILLTMHRQETVDNPLLLRMALHGVHLTSEALGIPALYPIHPRALDKIKSFNVSIPKTIKTMDPCGFKEFLALERNASLIMTDSGGVQEEACILGVPCVTLRGSTERPETLEINANTVSGLDPDDIKRCALAMFLGKREWQHPFGDGHAAERILDILEDK